MNLRFYKTITIFLSAAMLFLFTGCASTWVEKSPEFAPKKPAKTLVCYYKVTGQGGADIFDLAKQGAGGKAFGDVSMNTYKLMAESLKKFNIDLKTSRTRTKKLDTIAKKFREVKTGNNAADKLLGSLTQEWTHPATSDVPFHHYSKRLIKEAVKKVRTNNKNELFLAANLKIEDQDQYLLFKRFRVILGLKVINTKGDIVFQAKTEGFTGLKFLRNPISAERIEKAMAQALAKMQEVQVKSKISTINTI